MTNWPAKRMFIVSAVLLSSWCTTSTTFGQETGGVKGIVLGASKQPVPGVQVYAALPERPTDRVGTLAITDSQGRFSIAGTPAGTYELSAFKESDGYPNRVYYPYQSAQPLDSVTIRPGEIVEGIVIRLGPRAARLVGTIVDSDTGKPLTNTLMIFYEANSSQEYMGLGGRKSGKFSVLAPTGPFRLKVTAPGYAAWYYSEDGAESGAKVIRLQSGITKKLVISLSPVK